METLQVLVGQGANHSVNALLQILVQARQLEDIQGWHELGDEHRVVQLCHVLF